MSKKILQASRDIMAAGYDRYCHLQAGISKTK